MMHQMSQLKLQCGSILGAEPSKADVKSNVLFREPSECIKILDELNIPLLAKARPPL